MMENNKSSIIKKSFKDIPHTLRGIRPEDCLLFKGDPDIGYLNIIKAEEFKKLYEACRPKQISKVGKMLILGTEGNINNNYKDIFYGK